MATFRAPRVTYSKCPSTGREQVLHPTYKVYAFRSEWEALRLYYAGWTALYSCIHVRGKGCLRVVLDGTCPIHAACACPVRAAVEGL